MTKHFYDKTGQEIKPDMLIQHDNGEIEKVYPVEDSEGNYSLGIEATNPDFLKYHPCHEIEYYDLSNFDMSEWKIIK